MEIRLLDVSKSFGTKSVIQKTSFLIDDGSFTTLLGASGCGKTTLLRIISGLETPDSGEIYFGERCVFSHDRGINIPPEKRGLGFVFQDFALWPHMTVYENVAFGLRAAKQLKDLDAKVRGALHAVQLDDFADRFPHQLSGGQQQRVAFARAIVIEPECILFDEPLSALDALLREEMRTELRELITRLGITAVFVTHDQTEAMSMSDKIAVLSGGGIEQYDTPEHIYDFPKTEFVARFIGSSNWIDQDRMCRPEKCSLTESAGSVRFEAEVTSIQFLGNTYQLHLKYGDQPWVLLVPERKKIGEILPVYINESDIIKIKRTAERK
jgi:iron(III) transport system ATP-binding protein